MGIFPSAAIAWDIAQESFMSNQHVLDQLKLRASFGVTGNQDIAAYSTLGMLSGASYGWGTSTSSTGYWGISLLHLTLRGKRLINMIWDWT